MERAQGRTADQRECLTAVAEPWHGLRRAIFDASYNFKILINQQPSRLLCASLKGARSQRGKLPRLRTGIRTSIRKKDGKCTQRAVFLKLGIRNFVSRKICSLEPQSDSIETSLLRCLTPRTVTFQFKTMFSHFSLSVV